MSAGGAFGGARGYQPRPPEKGVFPLDHFGECKSVKEAYLACLQKNGSHAQSCQALSKEYLECRMDRNLMAKQDLRELGFGDRAAAGESDRLGESKNEKRKQAGFVAGIK